MSSAALAQKAPGISLQLQWKFPEEITYLTHDGTSRLFVVQQEGLVRLIVNGTLQQKPYLDIESKVWKQNECGFLSIAFHPKFAQNGRMFAYYTTKTPKLRVVVSEFKAKPGAAEIDPATEKEIFTYDKPGGERNGRAWDNHNGGQLQFGPDGMLYIGTGDGGAGGDPQNLAQNPKSLLGKILRVDVDGGSPYSIPKDNPFVGNSNFAPEVYAWGLRNPWRFSFDPVTKLIYAGDVGQGKLEEIDIITPGGNYGWRVMEGTATHNSRDKVSPEVKSSFIPPIAEYGRNDGISVTGGYVYRGKEFPALVGWYLYADFASGNLWGLKYENGKKTAETLFMKARARISSFGIDKDGEIYACDHGGKVFKIVSGNGETGRE